MPRVLGAPRRQEPGLKDPPLSLRGEHSPAGFLVLDFWPQNHPRIPVSRLFCYSRPRKLMHLVSRLSGLEYGVGRDTLSGSGH